jgi:hypothetical protein
MAYDEGENPEDFTNINVGPYRPGTPKVVYFDLEHRIVLHYNKATYERAEKDALGDTRWVHEPNPEIVVKKILVREIREKLEEARRPKAYPQAKAAPETPPDEAVQPVPDNDPPF